MISVCIATYNGGKYIKAQLESILPQIGAEDEIIISDDGSTDDTLDIINRINDHRIKVLRHKPYTKTSFPLDKPTHNFENALRAAKGDFIFLSDQDDIWLENKVTACLNGLQTADLVVSDCKVTDSKLNIIYDSYFSYIKVRQGVLPNIIRATYLGCCMAFRKEVLDKALPFPQTCVGHDLWIGLIADQYFKSSLLKTPLILYRKHELSMTPSGKKSSYSLFFKIRYRLYIVFYLLRKIIC